MIDLHPHADSGRSFRKPALEGQAGGLLAQREKPRGAKHIDRPGAEGTGRVRLGDHEGGLSAQTGRQFHPEDANRPRGRYAPAPPDLDRGDHLASAR